MNRSPVIAISVDEASGNLLGVHPIRAIKQRRPDAKLVGIGGERMKAEGFGSLYDQEKLAVRGFVEVVKRLPKTLRVHKGLVNDLIRIKPDVFVGIDTPDFNLGVAEKLKKVGIPTVHYVSPLVWVWRRERVNKTVHQVNRVLCLFPMEPQLYLDAGGRTELVGHPTAQTMPLDDDRAAVRAKLGVADEAVVFALLPGSRVNEIGCMTPLFFQMALLLLKRYPQAQFLLPAATAVTRRRIGEILAQLGFSAIPVIIAGKQSGTVCTTADVVLVTSGAVALEVASYKQPMVISYKISPLTYFYVKHKVKIPYVGLPNVPLGKAAVPEPLQHDAEPEKLAAAVAYWYNHPEAAATLKQDFHELRLLLCKNADALAAEAVLSEVGF